MKLSQEVDQFSSACERLIAVATTSTRAISEAEARIVDYYCNEVRKKVVPESLRSIQ